MFHKVKYLWLGVHNYKCGYMNVLGCGENGECHVGQLLSNCAELFCTNVCVNTVLCTYSTKQVRTDGY